MQKLPLPQALTLTMKASIMQLYDIANALEGTVRGETSDCEIFKLVTPETGSPGSITVASTSALLQAALTSNVSAIVTDETVAPPTCNKPLILVKDCQTSLTTLLKLFTPAKHYPLGIHPSAVVDEGTQLGPQCSVGAHVVIGKNCHIGAHVRLSPGVVIGDNVTIGNHCTIHPNVTIYDHCQIGDTVTIHANSVIGCDGFGYHFDGTQHQKRYHIGNVNIENNVEIGANTTIDRATIDSTIIGEGTKIDNQVQIAHNVQLGRNNILCAFTGIAGSSISGNNVTFAAGAGIGDHVTIEDNVLIGARTGIPSNKKLAKGTTWLGYPGRPFPKAMEQIASMQSLPHLRKKLQTLQKRISELEKQFET